MSAHPNRPVPDGSTAGPSGPPRTKAGQSGRGGDAVHNAADKADTVELGAEGPVPQPSPCPAAIGRYKVVSRIGTSGQAEIFRAVHPTLNKDVVIKLGLRGGPCPNTARELLISEGEILSKLGHPNIARIYDLDFADDQVFLVMEYVNGQNLAQHATLHPLSYREVARFAAKLGRALAAAHAQGVVHRDVKPENVVVDESGEPKLIDFGIGRLVDAWREDSEEHGRITGTPAYMSPEQALGETDRISHRTDIFGLGAVLYFLLVGKPPFAGATKSECVRRASSCSFERPRDVRNHVPRQLERICLRAMAKEPEDRFARATDVARRLEGYAHGPKRLAAVACGVVLTAIVVVLALMMSRGGRPGAGEPRLAGTQEPPADVAVRRSERVPSPTHGTVPASGMLSRSADDVLVAAPGTLLASRPRLEVLVTRSEKGPVQMLLRDAVPLRAGDRLQLGVTVPAGYQSSLFWYDTERKLHELNLTPYDRSGETIQLAYPPRGKDVTLEGPPGTELLLLVADREDCPSFKDVRRVLDESAPWPTLPPKSVLVFDREIVTFQGERGPGAVRESLMDQTVRDRVGALQQAMTDRKSDLVGLAFPHVE